MGIANIINNSTTTSGGEIVRELVNSSDGQGLHFNGAGNIDVASPPDLGAFAVYINNGSGYSTGATSMTVDALKAEIPSGTVLTFDGGGQYLVTSTAAVGATTIVSTVGLALASVADNAGAAYGGANEFSFELVIKADEFGASDPYLIDFSNGGRFVFGSTSSQSYNLGIYDNAGAWDNFGVKVLDDLKVHHLVMTVDGTTATLYDNGNQVGTQTISAAHGINNCTDLVICNDPFKGAVYRTRFYNKALTPAEVQTAYERADVNFVDQYGSHSETSTNNFVNNAAPADFAGFSGNAGGFTTTGSATNNAAYKNQTFTAGKKYRLKFTVTDGNSSDLLLLFRSSADGAGSNVGKIDSSNKGTVVSNTYLQLEHTGDYELILSDLGSAQSIRVYAGSNVGAIDISAFSIFQIGCVTDYDLAFANPTQSRTVQDRSGAADGTTSASGVSQVQPVVQLNSKAARIGTSAATPADNQLIVGAGNGAAQADADDIIITGGSGVNSGITFNTPNAGGYLYFADGNENDDLYRGFIKYVHSGNAMEFGTNALSRLAIDANGRVHVGTGTASQVNLNVTGTSGSGGVMQNALTTGHITNGTNLGSYGFKGTDSGNNNDAAEAKITAVAAETHSGSTAATDLVFYTKPSSTGPGSSPTERMRISSTGLATFNNGIALQTAPTNPDATDNEAYTLDKYETGTWTPVYAPSSGSFATMTMDVLSAKYTRIGNAVLVQATIRTDDVDITGGSGSLRINGLPFPVAGSGAYGTVYIGEAGSFASGKFPCAGYCTVSQSYISLTKLSGVAGSILGAQVDSLTTGTTANQNSLIFAARYTA